VIQSAISGVEKGVRVDTSRVDTSEARLERLDPRGAQLSYAVRCGASMGNGGDSSTAWDPAEMMRAVAERQDRSAFAALFARYAPRIKMMLMRMGTPAEVAEDIAQEALLVVWRKAAYYEPSRTSVSAWIYTIARNLRIDRLRRDQRMRLHTHYEAIEQDEPPRPDGALDAMEREQQVQAALGQLSDDQVRIVRLSFFEGCPHSNIAELLDIPLGTVKSRLRLALNRLRELLGHMS
jgi:RNA polymerase sigma-70 factor, ECF subfamily